MTAGLEGWQGIPKKSSGSVTFSCVQKWLIIAVGFFLFAGNVLQICLIDHIKSNPIKVTVEKPVPVEKIKYVRTSGLKTSTVELIRILNSKIDPKIAEIISQEVEAASKKYGLPIPLILSVIRKESNYNPQAVSKAGAVGLMQVMPKIHKAKYEGRNLYHIATNIDVGCQILREYLDKEGTLDKMFHAYLSKNAKKSVIDAYRNDIKNYWVKLEMHDYENGKDEKPEIHWEVGQDPKH